MGFLYGKKNCCKLLELLYNEGGFSPKGYCMKITNVRVRRVLGEGKLKAYATITFDDCFVIHNVKVIEGKNGAFIAMPSRKTKKGEYKDVAHPIHSDFRNELQSVILSAYGETAEFIDTKNDED